MFYPGDGRCARYFAGKAPLVKELKIFEQRLPRDKGTRTDVWIEALTRVLLLLVSRRTIRLSGQMYLHAWHRARSDVQGLVTQLTTLTLDGVFSSSLVELAAFFGCLLHSKRLAMDVVTVRGGDHDDKHESRLCKELQTLKVEIGYVRAGDALPFRERQRHLVLPRLASLDASIISSDTLPSTLGIVDRLKKLAINVVIVGRGDDDDDPHELLCKTLKVGIGHIRARWMRFLFERDGIISLESLRELLFPVTSGVVSWMPGAHELFEQAPRVDTAMLLDWRGSCQNLDHINLLPDINNLRSLVVFVPLACTGRYEVRRALVPKSVKVNTADTAICALDWTRRMQDTGTRLKEVVLLVKASSVADEQVVREAWTRLLRQSIVVRVEGECSEMIRACLACAGGESAGRRELFYEL